MTFESFPLPDYTPDQQAADDALARQDALQGQVIDALAASIIGRLQGQELFASQTARKLGRAANARLKAQQSAADEVATVLRAAADLRLGQQSETAGLLAAQGMRPASGDLGMRGSVAPAGQFTQSPLAGGAPPSPGLPQPQPFLQGTAPPAPAAPPLSQVGTAGPMPGAPVSWTVWQDTAAAAARRTPCYFVWDGQGVRPSNYTIPVGSFASRADAQAYADAHNQTCGPGANAPSPAVAPPAPPTYAGPAPAPRPINVASGGDERPDPLAPVCPVDPCAPAYKKPTVKVLGADDERPDCAALLPDWAKDGLPTPGSKAWCDAASTIRTGIGALGLTILRWIQDQPGDLDLWLSSKATDLKDGAGAGFGFPQWWAGALIEALAGAAGEVSKVVNLVVNAYKCFATANPDCSGTTLLGCAIVRGALRWMENAEIGLAIPIKVTVRLGALIPQFRRAADYILESACPSLIPSTGDAIHAYAQGQIDYATLECWLLMHGNSPDVWSGVINSRSQRIGAQQVIEYGRRTGMTDAGIQTALENHGWMLAPDRVALAALYDKLPDLQSSLQWHFRDAFDDDLARVYGLDDGFAEQFWPRVQMAQSAAGVSRDSALRSYRARWAWPGAAQLADWLMRSRSGIRGEDFHLSEEDYLKLLGVQDIPPAMRPMMLRAAYRPMSTGTARQFWDVNVIDEARFRAALMDDGVEPMDLDTVMRGETTLRQRRLASQGQGFTIGAAALLVRLGAMTEQDAVDSLASQGYTLGQLRTAVVVALAEFDGQQALRAMRQARMSVQRSTLSAYDTGTVSVDSAVSALVSAGFPPQAALAQVQARDAAHTAKLAQTAIASFKKAYMSGELSPAQASNALATAGITPERSAQYLTEWALTRTPARKQASTSNILAWMGEGMISPEVARQRLRNLGWSNPDAILLLREAEGKIAERAAKAADAAGKTARTQAAQAAKLASEAQKQAATLTTQAGKLAPLASVKTWWKEGIIDDATALSYIQGGQFSATDANRYLAQWKLEQQQAQAKEAARQAARLAKKPLDESLSTIKAWYKDGIITEQQARTEMTLLGVPDDDLDKYIQEWNYVKPKAGAGQPPAGPAG